MRSHTKIDTQRMRGHSKKDTIKNEMSHQKRHTKDIYMRGHTKKDTHKISIWEVTPKQRDTHLHSLAFSKFNSFMKLNFFTSSSCENLINFYKI